MGGDSNPRCLSAHTLSRRAQSTTLSPIQGLVLLVLVVVLVNRAWLVDLFGYKDEDEDEEEDEDDYELELQPPK